MNEKKYNYPNYYKFPPFFTLQPVMKSRAKQIELWLSMLLDYSNQTKTFTLSYSSDIFHNKVIARDASTELMDVIFHTLVERNLAEFTEGDKKSISYSWKTPLEWSKVLHSWAVTNSHVDVILTCFELTHDELYEGEEFFQLPDALLLKALRILEKSKKATLLTGSVIAEYGVKFLSE